MECISFTQVEWIFSLGRSFPCNVAVDVNLIKIKKVRIDNAGIYRCLGSNKNSEQFWAISVVYVVCKFLFVYTM